MCWRDLNCRIKDLAVKKNFFSAYVSNHMQIIRSNFLRNMNSSTTAALYRGDSKSKDKFRTNNSGFDIFELLRSIPGKKE